MKHIKILIFSIFILLCGCATYEKNKVSKDDSKIYYSSSGFALVYEDSLYENNIVNKKINNEDLAVMHISLKKNTTVRITNLHNSKYVDTKIYKNADYPKIFNVVISKKIASLLDLNIENPFIEIIELKKNKKFIAKDGNIFEEEKNVADKAPVSEIQMNDLTVEKTKVKKKESQNEKYILVISDFYYENTALELRADLIKKINLSNIFVRKINNKKYRLLVGPFKNFNALKTTYISLNNLGFENLDIYKK